MDGAKFLPAIAKIAPIRTADSNSSSASGPTKA